MSLPTSQKEPVCICNDSNEQIAANQPNVHLIEGLCPIARLVKVGKNGQPSGPNLIKNQVSEGHSPQIVSAVGGTLTENDP